MKHFLSSLIVLAAVSAMAFGSAQKEGASAQVWEIRHMSPHTQGSQFSDFFNAAIDRFNASHTNARIVHDALPSAQLRTKITVEIAANNPPDSSWLILSYAREFMRDNKLEDWAPIYDDKRHAALKEWFPRDLREYSRFSDGRLMLCPYELSMDAFYYNTELFKKHGWTPPRTHAELIDIAKKARGQNLYAMVTGGKDIRFAWQASALLMRTAGKASADALALGPALDKWNDPKYGFPQAMQKFKEMVDAKAYAEGVLGMGVNEADQFFVNESALMYYEGAWKPGGWVKMSSPEWVEKLRRIQFPAMPDMPNGDPKGAVGGPIIGLALYAGQPEAKKQMTIEWLKTIAGPEFWQPVMETGSNLPVVQVQYDRKKVFTVMNEIYDYFLTRPAIIPSMDAYAAPPIDLAIKKTAMPGLITGQFNVEQAIAEVQRAAEEYVKTLPK
jgi:raffinose/stachyose/melibiose transport system substrate-binding protein